MYGPRSKDILTILDSANIAVVEDNAVVYTASFELRLGVYFGVAYRAVSSGGSPSVKIEFEESWVKPATEGSADGNYVVPTGFSDIESDLTTELWKIKSLSPIPMQYARFKITGSGTNPADTIVNIKVSTQEDYL